MAELWSGFLQLNHFPRDNTIDLCVKGNALVHSQDARLGYSDSPSHCKPQSCCHLCAPKQQLTRAGKSSAWGFLSSAETHFLLSKCWFNTRGTAFANCKILSLKRTVTSRTTVAICVGFFCHRIPLSPGLTLPSLISFQLSTWRDSADTWAITEPFIRAQIEKCFVCLSKSWG